MKKLIGVLIAALMIFQSFAVMAASVYVDGSLQVRTGDNEYSLGPIDAVTTDEIDYLAAIDMSSVREAFSNYCATAEAAGVDLSTVPISGSFTITAAFPEDMTIPAAFTTGGSMAGFSEEANYIFGNDQRTVTTADGMKTVTITLDVVGTEAAGRPGSVNASELLANIDAYLSDFSLTCENVTVGQNGTYVVTGGLSGQVNTSVSGGLTVDIATREEISAQVNVSEFYEISIQADDNVSSITLVSEDGRNIVLNKSENTYSAMIAKGTYTIQVEVSEGTAVDKATSTVGLNSAGELALNVNGITDATIATIEDNGITLDELFEPPAISYTEGQTDVDLTGLVFDVLNPDGTVQSVVYNEENADQFTVKPAVDSTDLIVIYDNIAITIPVVSTTLTTVAADIVAPVARAQVSTVATAPVGANYTLGEVSWSPEVAGTYAYSTIYTATVVATANDGCTFADTLAATVNGADANVTVDGNTATITFEFPRTNSSGGGTISPGGGGGGFGTGGSATATPAPSSSAAPGATATPDPEGWDNPFTDVASSDWFYDAVRYVNENGLMNGTEATVFSPNMDLTRGMFITIIYRFEGEPDAAGTVTFQDVDASEYYADAVAWGSANGIINGYSETEFAPNDTIIREQMAAMMARYAAYKGIDTASAPTATYADSDQISEYAVPAVNFCTSIGLMSGVGDNMFAPQDNTTRAEVATVIMRLGQQFAAAQATPAPEAEATAAPEATATPEAE